MSRRREEHAFGSDSFLDILANVVGILIILIIVVGLRVSRSPAPPAPRLLTNTAAEPDVPAPAPALPLSPPPLAALAPQPPRVIELEPLIIDEPAPPPPAPRTIIVERPLPALPAPVEPQEQVEVAAGLRDKINKSTAQSAALTESLAAEQQKINAARSRLAAAERESQAADQRRAQTEQEMTAARAELAEVLDQLAALKANLSSLDEPPAPTAIPHRVSPIGKAVTGTELHFHVAGGMVARVPVDQLASRLKLHIERQKELLARMDRYEGAIDPIDGFRMHYVIEKSRLSLTEELKFGQNLVRMQVTQWVLQPEPGLQAETAAEAVQRGSAFYQALLSAGPNTSLTFWVYPDSFEAFAKLKEFAYRHGYEVAARPLPFGVPIAGSPEGAKSVAQ